MQVTWLSKLMWRGAMINFASPDDPYPWDFSTATKLKYDAEPRKLLEYLWSR